MSDVSGNEHQEIAASDANEDVPEYRIKFTIAPESLEPSFRAHFPNYPGGLSRGEPGGFVLSDYFLSNAELMYRFKPRPDDVWIVTFPKCGTTWTQEMVWMIMNNCDAETAASIPLQKRAPFLEMPTFVDPSKAPPGMAKLLNQFIPGIEYIENLPSPRVIKTHLPLYLLHPKLLDTAKVVYVARNPKDVIVSYYHHHRLIPMMSFTGSLDEFAEYFMKDLVWHAPYFPHLIEAWGKRNHPNLLFLFYEDMKKDLKGEVAKVAQFLGKTLSGEQLQQLRVHLHIDTLSQNNSVNYESGREHGLLQGDGKFIRKGKTGDWKNHFSPELNAKIDEWMSKNLDGTDLTFVTELEHQD